MYAGLRLGELRALRWEDVDLAEGVIHVRRSYDREGDVTPKSEAGHRDVPIAAVLHDVLAEHKANATSNQVFPGERARSFAPGALYKRARRAWGERELNPITLHECRHTFASLMIAAGISAKALSTYMGHSSIAITYDRYGKLFPGNLRDNALLLDAFLEPSDGRRA